MDPFAAHALEVAPSLLGARLSANGVTIRLTEVEAYGGVGEDPGSHAFRGPGRRNATMFGPSGRLYVYFTYGMHFCANAVCGPAGEASAVLLRAGEVVDGIGLARERRPAARRDAELASGPARLAVALGLTGADDGAPLSTVVPVEHVEPATQDVPADADADGHAAVRLRLPSGPAPAFATGPRTGVAGPGGDGVAFPWRFWLPGDPTVSPYRAHRPKRRRPPG